jgi:ribulose-phosphate 3-epimerase
MMTSSGTMHVSIAPSLASAPMGHLADTIAELERAGADALHFDLEDGHFVPVMTLGTRLIAELRPLTHLPFDVHLMVDNPEQIIPLVTALGADAVSVHYEACLYPRRTLRMIRQAGKQAGLAFNPKTPFPRLDYLLPHLDFVLILTTEPEMPDCPYLPAVLDNVRAAAAFAGEYHPRLGIVADGGIDATNIAEVVAAGATAVVSGRGVFAGGEVAANLRRLRNALRSDP